MEKIITEDKIMQYERYLREEEKAAATIQKYTSDLRKLAAYADGMPITKEIMLGYKQYLKKKGYSAASINSYLVAANRFFEYMEWYGIRVKQLRLQREAYVPEERELTKTEYKRLVKTAKKMGKHRLAMIITTICATGIRISELSALTAAGVRRGVIYVDNKGKIRKVLIPVDLQKRLLLYMVDNHIKRGVVFSTSKGNPVDRSNIWKEMKSICRESGVNDKKVYPHSLRRLFARIFYSMEKDIAKLADILGHGSIETTRIYIRTSSREYMRQMKRMDMIVI